MNNAIVKQFDSKGKLVTFIWKGRPAWIAKQIAELAGQIDTSTSTHKFLKDNEFLEEFIDYEKIKGEELKELKKIIEDCSIILKGKHITIFYESALWAYLQSLRTEPSKQLKRWINRDVLPSIRENGTYISNNSYGELSLLDKTVTEAQTIIKEDDNKNIGNNVRAMNAALESFKMFNDLIDETGLESDIKLIIAKELFEKIGVNIPIDTPVNVDGKTRKRRKRVYVKYSIDNSKYKDEVNEMLRNKVKYEDISNFLKSKGENISKSSVGRYARHLFENPNLQSFEIICSKQGGGNNNV